MLCIKLKIINSLYLAWKYCEQKTRKRVTISTYVDRKQNILFLIII